MGDDLEEELSEWGRSETPPVEGAFANRLETSLRREMLDRSAVASRGWSAVFFRPGVVVMAIAVLIFGFAFVSRAADEVGVADGNSTVPIPTTVVVATTSSQSTQAPGSTRDPIPPSTDKDVQPQVTTTASLPPNTTAETAPTVSDQTTIPRPTVPATTIPPEATIDLAVRRDGRRVTASWTASGETDSIVGWVLIASIDGDGDLVATSREAETRSLSGPLTDLGQTFRVEGRDRGGVVVVMSEEVALSRGE